MDWHPICLSPSPRVEGRGWCRWQVRPGQRGCPGRCSWAACLPVPRRGRVQVHLSTEVEGEGGTAAAFTPGHRCYSTPFVTSCPGVAPGHAELPGRGVPDCGWASGVSRVAGRRAPVVLTRRGGRRARLGGATGAPRPPSPSIAARRVELLRSRCPGCGPGSVLGCGARLVCRWVGLMPCRRRGGAGATWPPT